MQHGFHETGGVMGYNRVRNWPRRSTRVRRRCRCQPDYKSQIGKMWTWVCSCVGLVNAWNRPQLNTSTRGGEKRAELGFSSQTQGPGESPSASEDRVTVGKSLYVESRVTRPEKWCFPSQLPVLSGNSLDSLALFRKACHGCLGAWGRV